MKFINVIPARKGSKGIKNKNLTSINGKKLIEYTFEAILKGKLGESYIISDDKKIKSIAAKYKINNEYIRPKKLSRDDTSITDTLHDFACWYLEKKSNFDYLVMLQPTSPLRTSSDIKKAINLVKKKNYESLFSISESLEHPYETIKVKNFTKNDWSLTLPKASRFYRRQDFDINSFFINGAVYIIKKNLILNKKIFKLKNHGLYIMPKSRSIDINSAEEINIVKKLLK